MWVNTSGVCSWLFPWAGVALLGCGSPVLHGAKVSAVVWALVAVSAYSVWVPAAAALAWRVSEVDQGVLLGITRPGPSR